MMGSPFEVAWTNKNSGYDKMYRIQHGGAINDDGRGVRRVHPTQKPVRLMRRIIEDHTKAGHTILDPFVGSGTTLVAAASIGRKAIGIEIEERYCEIAARRLDQMVMQLDGTAA